MIAGPVHLSGLMGTVRRRVSRRIRERQRRIQMENAERIQPQDMEAERSVIGSCLLNSNAIDEVLLLVSPESFYGDGHQKLFSAIVDMHAKGIKGIDPVTVGHELSKRGHLDDVGGPAAIVKILETVPHSAHAEYYAGIVREKCIRRKVVDSWKALADAAYSETEDIESAIEKHDTATQRLLEESVGSGDLTDMAQVLSDWKRDLEDPDHSETVVHSGFSSLDAISSGMYGGNLIVLAARASMGKTAFALSMARNILKSDEATLFFSLEMGRREVAERMLSLEARISTYQLRQNNLSEMDMFQLEEANTKLNKLPLLIDDRGDRTVGKIAATSRLYKRKQGLSMVVIDYLQLIEPEDVRVQREQQVARITRRLKLLARDLDIPVVVLAQLNREADKRSGNDKRPRLSDLRESGAIEQDADQVWFVYRDDYYFADDPGYTENGTAEIIVAKNRNGPLGTAKLSFRKQYMLFEEDAMNVAAVADAW